MASQYNEPGTTTYIFGPYRLIPQRQLLLREGVPVRIGGRVFDILTLLVRRAGDVVSKNELITFCWPSTYVEESNLKVNIARLRRILAEGTTETLVASVAGRGYRFVAHVDVQRGEPVSKKALVTSSNLVLQRPDVVGRSELIDTLVDELQKQRLLTIVGPGGMGKTTVALAVAHRVFTDYAQGVFFIDFATVGDSQYAVAAIASGIGVRQSSEDTLSEIVALLHQRDVLLILDNCEHLAPTISSIVDRMLGALPTLKILATSREPLQVADEQVRRLPNLSVPDTEQGSTAAEAMEFGAVKLFVARANARASYVLNDEDAPLVSAICRRLDGIPLAIELAASKTFAYGIHTLLTMLEQKFLLLSNGERSAPLRQQTLLATLDWSYRLLSEDEAALLRLLSVFAGRFGLQDAVAMADAISFDATTAIDCVERLTSKSLVCADYQNGSLSYRLLESTRAFAVERLHDAGERDDCVRSHAWQTLALFERAAAEADNRDKRDWMAEYAHRIDDARNAMTWAFGTNGDQMLGVRLTAAAIPLWYELSSLNEMQSRVERALLATRDLGDCPKELTLKLIAARASGMTFAQHLPLDTEAAWQECYRLGVESGNTKYQIFGLWGLCSYLIYTGRHREGLAGLENFVELARGASDYLAVDEASRMMATAEIYIGQIGSARQRIEQLAAKHQRMTDPVRFARFQAERGVSVRCTLSLVLWVSGEVTKALSVARAAVERAETSGHVVSHSNALAVFAVPLSIWSGEYESAENFLDLIEDNGRREDIGVWRESCRFYKCYLRAKWGEAGAADELRQRLRELIEARHLLRLPMHINMVAEALLDAGQAAEAKTLVDSAYDLAREQEANWCLPEIIRIASLVELAAGNRDKAERLLLRAIRQASEIGALTLELRSTLTLAKMLAAEGRETSASDHLAAISCKFPEHEEFVDLAEVRRMLRLFRERSTCIA